MRERVANESKLSELPMKVNFVLSPIGKEHPYQNGPARSTSTAARSTTASPLLSSATCVDLERSTKRTGINLVV